MSSVQKIHGIINRVDSIRLWLLLAFTSCFLGMAAQNDQMHDFIEGRKILTDNLDTTVRLIYMDTLSIPSFTEFDVQVVMKTGHEISAISLGFYFPDEYLEIKGMELAQGTQGFYYSVEDGLFSLAWSDINPLSIIDEGVILTLKMKSLDISERKGTIKLEVDELSEFADESANIIENVILEVPEIEYLIPDNHDSLGNNYVKVFPNPFNDHTSVNFYLDADGQVKIAICNLDGKELHQIADGAYSKGTHQVNIYGLDLSKGIYLLRFGISNDDMSGTKLIKIMSTR